MNKFILLRFIAAVGTPFAYTEANGAEYNAATISKHKQQLTAQRHVKETDMYGCDIGSVMGWGNVMTHLIFMILVVSLAAVFISRMMPQQKKNMDSADSLSILKRRLASGEISLEEYEKLKKVI